MILQKDQCNWQTFSSIVQRERERQRRLQVLESDIWGDSATKLTKIKSITKEYSE